MDLCDKIYLFHVLCGCSGKASPTFGLLNVGLFLFVLCFNGGLEVVGVDKACQDVYIGNK